MFNHFMFLMNDGTVRGYGYNGYGQLGLGNTTQQNSIVNIPISNVKDISCGGYHTMFLLNDDTVKGCGRNDLGQLGIGNTTQQNSIVNIPISNVKDIICGGNHTMFLLNDGTVKGCGYNGNGQLGIGNTTDQKSIVNIPINNVKDISCGGNHTIFLLNDGTVKGCGANAQGQLGIGNTTQQKSIVNIPINNVKNIACGQYHTVFLLNDDTVKGCGYNYYGELGFGNTTQQNSPVNIPISNVKDIVCGNSHTMFLLNDGTVKGCGYNAQGQLGIGNTTNQKSIVNIPISNVKNIIAGSTSSFFITNDNTIHASGALESFTFNKIAPYIYMNNMVDMNNSNNRNKVILKKNNKFLYYNGTWNIIPNFNEANPTVTIMEQYGYPYIPSDSNMPEKPYTIYAYNELDSDPLLIQEKNSSVSYTCKALLNNTEVYNETFNTESNLNIPIGGLVLGSNTLKVIVSGNGIPEKSFEYTIYKEDSNTFNFIRRFEYDLSLASNINLTTVSGVGAKLKDNSISGSQVLDIPTDGKASIKSIVLNADSDKSIIENTSKPLVLENGIYKDTISLGTHSKVLNIKIL